MISWTFILLVVIGNAQDVLSSASSPTRQTTSQGQLASGLEIINENLVQLARQTNEYAETESRALNQALTLTTSTSALLVRSQIISLQQELGDTQETIEELQARISQSTQMCSGLSQCSDCADNEACVWCSAEQQCVAGDSNGPLGGECSAFLYGACGAGCAELRQCVACVANSACAWCSNGGVCSDSGNGCDASFLVAAGANCPATQTVAYQSATPNSQEDTQLSRLQRSLLSNTRRAQTLQEQLDALQSQLDVVDAQMQTELSQVEPLNLENELTGVADVVDATAASESKN